MNPILSVAGALVVAGGIACVSARRPAAVALGVALLLAASPLLIQPLPATLLLLERVVGAGLAAELLWLGLRGRIVTGASALGWPALALMALAAFAVGIGGQRLVPGTGSPEALGTALALFTVAIVAVARRSDGVHLGLSAIVLIAGTGIVRLALSGPPSSLETLFVGGLAAAATAAVALVAPRPEDPVAEVPAMARAAGLAAGERGAPDDVRGTVGVAAGGRRAALTGSRVADGSAGGRGRADRDASDGRGLAELGSPRVTPRPTDPGLKPRPGAATRADRDREPADPESAGGPDAPADAGIPPIRRTSIASRDLAPRRRPDGSR